MSPSPSFEIRNPHPPSELDGASALSQILQIATVRAAECVNADPEMYARLVGKPTNPQQIGMIAGESTEQQAQYLKCGELLTSRDLNPRQRQIAAQIAALVVSSPDSRYTASHFSRECRAKPATVESALMALMGIHNLVDFEHEDQGRNTALLTRSQHRPHRKKEPHYGATPALRWLADNAERAPIGFRNALARQQTLPD